MASESESTCSIRSPSLDAVSADLSPNEQLYASATSVIPIDDKPLVVLQLLSELINAPNCCPQKFDPIFSLPKDIIFIKLSCENNWASKDSLFAERNYRILQDDNKVGSSTFQAQELNDSMTSSPGQLDGATTSAIYPVGESIWNNTIFIAAYSACSNGEDSDMQGTVCADRSPDEENLELLDSQLTDRNYRTLLQDENKIGTSNFEAQELNDSLTSSAGQLDAAATSAVCLVDESISDNLILSTADSACASGEDDDVRGTVCADQSLDEESFQPTVLLKASWIGTLGTRLKQLAVSTWRLWLGELRSILSRLAGVEIYIVSAGVVITAYGQLLLINKNYYRIFIIPVTILIFIAALWGKLWLRRGVKGVGSNKGKYGSKQVHDLVAITALPYCFLLLQVLVRNKWKQGADILVVSDFFLFLSSALGAVAVLIALLPVVSSPDGAQVLQLIHRTCITVLTITVHTMIAEWVGEDMVLVCMQELVTVLVWLTVPFSHGIASGGHVTVLADVDVKEEEEGKKKKKDMETEEEEKQSRTPCEQPRRPLLGVATKWLMNITTQQKIIITTVLYMMLTFMISAANGNEGKTKALIVCSCSGCLNYFSMYMLQQWPGSGLSDVLLPVKLLEVFAKICFAAAAPILGVVISARWGHFMTFRRFLGFVLLPVKLLQVFAKICFAAAAPISARWGHFMTFRRFLRCVALEVALFYLRWRPKISDRTMDLRGRTIPVVPVKLLEVLAEAVLAAVISADFMFVSPDQTILPSVHLFQFDFLRAKRRFLTYIAVEGILFYLVWRPKIKAGRMVRKVSDHGKLKLE